MSLLYTISYPELPADELATIENFRREHDLPHAEIVPAHFTLLFGVRDVPEAAYVKHVRSIAASASPVPFTCRYAMLGTNNTDGTAHVFLVPDEGYAAISLLHDQLYSGVLEASHRLDIPYIPHITIGTLVDRRHAKALCDQLNQAGVSISGKLRTLTIGDLHGEKFINRHEVRLGARP